MIKTYDEFIDAAQRLGVMSFWAKVTEGFPSLSSETTQEQWHTDNPQSDPWRWKVRCAEEGLLSFGATLNGNKCFLTKELFPYFYAAYREEESIEERYFAGKLTPLVRDMYALFERDDELSTAQIRRTLGIKGKEASKADGAMVMLQKEFLISQSGTTRKISKMGIPYGWEINTFRLTDTYYADWLMGYEHLSKEEAREYILDHCISWNRGIDRNDLQKQLFGKG